MTFWGVGITFPLASLSLLLGRKSTGAKTNTGSSYAGAFLTGHVPSPAAGLGLSCHGNSCDIARVTKGKGSGYPELGPQAGLA